MNELTLTINIQSKGKLYNDLIIDYIATCLNTLITPLEKIQPIHYEIRSNQPKEYKIGIVG